MAQNVGQTPMTRHRVVSAGAGAVATGVLAACGSLGPRGDAVARVPQGQTQISFLTDWSAGPRLKVIEDAAALWARKYPHIALEVRNIASRVQERLDADIAAGTQADVVLFSGVGVAAMREQFVDLMPFIKRDKFDMKD